MKPAAGSLTSTSHGKTSSKLGSPTTTLATHPQWERSREAGRLAPTDASSWIGRCQHVIHKAAAPVLY
jgi:hypothetical protein